MAICVDTNGISVGDRHLPFYAGSVDYWRHPVEAWKPLLERVKGLGFDILSMDIPWGIHEIGPSNFDFGHRDPSKNVATFIDTCRECGLYVLLRLGPFHDVDIPWAGLPQRIVRNSSMWAVTGSGSPALIASFPAPFPMPSLAADRLFQEFAKFLDALCPQFITRQDPDGPVVLIQAGGTLDLFQRYRAYDIDYSADAILFYRRFLADKYPSVDALNNAYGTQCVSFSEVQPPHRCHATAKNELPFYIDWIECKEALAADSVRRIIPLLRDRGMRLPLFHAVGHITTPINCHLLAARSEAQFVSLRLKYSPDRFQEFINRARYMGGTLRLPYATDFSAGARWTSPFLPTSAEQEFLILSAIMFGVSGFQFQLAAERDRWVGSPVTRDGKERDEFALVYKKLRKFIDDYHALEGKKVCRTLILLNNDIERYHLAVSNFDCGYLGLIGFPRAFSESLQHFGFTNAPYAESIRFPGRNWCADLVRLLESNQVEFNISDTNIPMDVLNGYDMVFLPMCDFITQADFEKIIGYVEHGGHVIMGPGQPLLNSQFQPNVTNRYTKFTLPGTASIGLGKITWQPDIPPLVEVLPTALQNEIRQDNPAVYLTEREGRHHLVFLANPTRQRQTAILITPWTLRGVWNLPDQAYIGSFSTEIEPFSVRVWEAMK